MIEKNVDLSTRRNEFENIDIKAQIGPIVFNVLLDSSFFDEKRDWTATSHNHSSFEVHFVVDGQGTLQVGQQWIRLSKSTFCLIGPGVYHTQKDYTGLRKYCMKFEYKAAKNQRNTAPSKEAEVIVDALSKVHCFFADDTYDNLSLIEAIHHEIKLQAIGYYTKIQCLFTQIILNLLRSIISQNHEENFPQKIPDERRSILIEAFFFQNYSRNAAARDLAAELNVSNRQLDRILKKLFNRSFKEKLIETRIEVAKDFLKNTDLPAHSIAEKVGYYSTTNFYNLFKQKTGFTPSDYRNYVNSR